jgi:hypothetical protein
MMEDAAKSAVISTAPPVLGDGPSRSALPKAGNWHRLSLEPAVIRRISVKVARNRDIQAKYRPKTLAIGGNDHIQEIEFFVKDLRTLRCSRRFHRFVLDPENPGFGVASRNLRSRGIVNAHRPGNGPAAVRRM